jgi:hypothetical protein
LLATFPFLGVIDLGSETSENIRVRKNECLLTRADKALRMGPLKCAGSDISMTPWWVNKARRGTKFLPRRWWNGSR